MHDRPDDPDAPEATVLDDAEPAPALGPGEPDHADLPPLRRWMAALAARSGLELAGIGVEALVVAAAVAFVLATLHPGLLILDTTPAGGDMGAHVWGPAYLRDHLLPSFRLSGWTPDWYAGFPAYVFYMVVPALAIVALDAGFEGWAALVPLAVGLGLIGVSAVHERRSVRRWALVGGLAVIVLGCGLPYGVAFKFVAVSGLLALPIACYVAGRLADLPFPGPPMLAIASVVFLFNREPIVNGSGTGNIIGGNVASTLAGEFSFSISLAFFVLYVGFMLRGLRTGKYRATAAVLLALCALCHIIPAIYAVLATVVALVVSVPLDRAKLRWFLPVGPVALALTAFWTLPFVANRAYLNDMGWEKLPGPCRTPDCAVIGDYLWPSGLRWVIALAVVGAAVSVLLRIRLGVFLLLTAVATGIAFVLAPQGRLWNARLLPLLYLCVALLAGLAFAELSRAVALFATARPERPISPITLGAPVVAALVVYVLLALPLGILPGAERHSDGDISWGPLTVQSGNRLVVRSWAEWNFRGYEQKPAYPEYYGMLEMAQNIADDPTLGCGRVMWEYENDRLNRYGTPMAPMLLPFWTDGCMGSMEGLYFEASSTTPYHFLNQRALSAKCSCAQRDLPYGSSFDIELGVDQLQTMGVRYYFAFSPEAVEAADAHGDLTPIGSTEVWHAYLVADSELVSPLTAEPAVLTGLEPGMSWVGPASHWFEDPARHGTALAADGPPEWQRIAVCGPAPEASEAKSGAAAVVDVPDDPAWTRLDVCAPPEVRPLPANEVSGVRTGTDSISFDVSTVGVPVVVKASYFPNWRAAGAEGPYRLTPNLMVVIPTDTHVELTYGRSGIDLSAYILTLLGILGAVALSRTRVPAPAPLWLDGPDPIVAGSRRRPFGEDGEDGEDDEDHHDGEDHEDHEDDEDGDDLEGPLLGPSASEPWDPREWAPEPDPADEADPAPPRLVRDRGRRREPPGGDA